MSEDKFSIEAVEQKANQLKQEVLELGYKILALMDENHSLPDDQKKPVPQSWLDDQKYKKSQYELFSKMYRDMKKTAEAAGNGGPSLSSISHSISEMGNALGKIQQKLDK